MVDVAWDGQGTAQHAPQLCGTDAHTEGSILCGQGSKPAAARRRTQCACARGSKPRPPGPRRLGCTSRFRVLSPAQGPEFDPPPLASYLVSLCNTDPKTPLLTRVPNSSLFCSWLQLSPTALPYPVPRLEAGGWGYIKTALCPGRDRCSRDQWFSGGLLT